MQTFTGYEYIKIDVANAFGLDKELFEDRLAWVDAHHNDLESLIDEADDAPLYLAAVMALRDAEAGIPTGHMVGWDACSSGIQIMGALIGCPATCESTGLVDPNRRADIYTDTTDVMNEILADQGLSVEVSRKELKPALMTHFYGSKEKPKEIFGHDTPELAAFYEALTQVAPGAVEVMDMLLNSWQPFALSHDWVLPDGFHAHCKVMDAIDCEFKIDELNGMRFTHRFYENKGTESGLSIAANVVHSIDGMLVREINRRCNYNRQTLENALALISERLDSEDLSNPLDYSKFISIREVDFINPRSISTYSVNTLRRLEKMITKSLAHKPFPIVCVHDEFKCHPNNMNHLRQTYIDLFCELGESNLLSDLLTQITGVYQPVFKHSHNISSLISQSNYGLS